ncbi:hypothetical protein L873DRAFT_1790081 [Choiromyces venosus 120613-1]|uniref:Uncharacterized protein n=1 Tax=Choiromyces venosus 120613-1 TaxID=1336337 RepID=A0A3N4JKB0_9PEZI|nr:hypothetical protein L873DRAFT_1790081 [Choiromyces venosus 120613-1]
MTGISDEDVEKILAEHSEQPRDVDEAMGIGKRAGDEIKAEARNLYEKYNLGGQDRTYSRIPDEIKRPAEDELYAWMSTRYPQFASQKYASWRMARAWKSLARRKSRRTRAPAGLNNGNPPPEEGGESSAADSKVPSTPETPQEPPARPKANKEQDLSDHGSSNDTGVVENGKIYLGDRSDAESPSPPGEFIARCATARLQQWALTQ